MLVVLFECRMIQSAFLVLPDVVYALCVLVCCYCCIVVSCYCVIGLVLYGVIVGCVIGLACY